MKPGLYMAKSNLGIYPVSIEKDNPIGGSFTSICKGDLVIYFGKVSKYNAAWVVCLTNTGVIGELVRVELEEVVLL